MAHTAKAVANHILDLAEAEGVEITPMKLQKLVYFAHGWHLAILNSPLINEQVECWKYGPVIRSLFHEFKEFGLDPITRRAVEHHFESDPASRRFKAWSSTAELHNPSEETLGLIKDVWQVYKIYSAVKLSNMTHLPDTPWTEINEKYQGNPPKGTDIPQELIQAYFQNLSASAGR